MDQYSPKLRKKLEVYTDRSRQSIVEWLNGYIMAESRTFPRRKELIEVFEYSMLDSHLSAVIENRKSKILGERWGIVDASGEVLEEQTDLLKKKWFKDFVNMALDAKFYGYSLIELGDLIDGEIKSVKLIERRNTEPYSRQVLIRPHDIYGFHIDEPEYRNSYILVDGGEGFGLLLKASPHVIYKRYALAAWTEHAEKFSLPLLHGKTNTQDADAVAKLKTELAAAGREMMMISDHGDEINAVVMGSSDAHKIYNELIDRINSEISKLIVGQTMTTDSGSSYSQANVHKSTAEEIAESDREYIENLVNDELLPRLVAMGYPLGDARFEFTMSRESSTEDKVKIFTLLLQHYDVAPDVIEDAFGVKVDKKEIPAPLAGAGFGKPKPGEEGKPGKF